MAGLEDRSALVVGAGGLGSPAAAALARAGVGRIGIVDCDRVEVSNLHRQLLHRHAGIGQRKAASAAERLRRMSPFVHVEEHDLRFDAAHAARLFSRYEVVLDATDTFGTRFLCNDAAVLVGRPLVHAGVVQLQGQVMTVLPGRGPCYRCLFREPPPPGEVPTCAQAGILGAVAGLLGALQAAEALKLLGGRGEALVGRLLVYEARGQRLREVRFARDPLCPVCGAHPTITSLDPERYGEPSCAA